MAERAATLEELRAVRSALEDLDQKLVPRDEFDRRVRRSGRRVAAALLIIVMGLAFAVFWNRATLAQAQRQSERDLRRLIQVCRVSTPTISPTDLRWCSARVPGFVQARSNAARAAQTAARNEQRLRTLETKVAKLEK